MRVQRRAPLASTGALHLEAHHGSVTMSNLILIEPPFLPFASTTIHVTNGDIRVVASAPVAGLQVSFASDLLPAPNLCLFAPASGVLACATDVAR